MAETQATSLPATTWQLSAPESYVLLNGPGADGTETFKLAVVELVTRGWLHLVEIEQPGFLGQTRRAGVLVRGEANSPPSEPLRSVCELFEGIDATTFSDGTAGVSVARLAAAAEARFGSMDRFATDQVLVELERRGLYARETHRIFWLFPTTHWRLTPEGQRALAELQRLIAIGDQRFRGWVDDNPSQALMYTALAGSALLLMNDAYPDVQRLHQGMDLGAGALQFDPSAFASLQDSFSTIDAGVESGAADGDWGGGSDDGDGSTSE